MIPPIEPSSNATTSFFRSIQTFSNLVQRLFSTREKTHEERTSLSERRIRTLTEESAVLVFLDDPEEMIHLSLEELTAQWIYYATSLQNNDEIRIYDHKTTKRELFNFPLTEESTHLNLIKKIHSLTGHNYPKTNQILEFLSSSLRDLLAREIPIKCLPYNQNAAPLFNKEQPLAIQISFVETLPICIVNSYLQVMTTCSSGICYSQDFEYTATITCQQELDTYTFFLSSCSCNRIRGEF